GKAVGIEVIVGVLLRLYGMERRQLRWLTRQFKIEAIHQLVVGQGGNANRKTGLKCRDTRECPTVHQMTFGAIELAHRRLPVVTKDEPVASVERRERAANARINRIENALKTRRLVNGF